MKFRNKVVMSILASSMMVGAQYFADKEVGACNIKGNISATGERIYHLPSQDYYVETAISFAKGERWFCSENEARQAGWRRSKV